MGEHSSTRAYLYIVFALIMILVNWESNLANAALLNPSIPEQSIRIRILANSDRVEDQWIKKEIRDAIVANVNTWNLDIEKIEDARNEVSSRLFELDQVVGKLLEKHGFSYGYKVELGKVDFPAKVFGNVTYPAGEYEALRVTLGEGQGENWWCVLFPPLCFGSAIKINENLSGVDPIAEKKTSTSPTRVYQAPVQDGDDVEVKFFLVEVLQKSGGFIKNWFS
jgi:stage II sporulation protein R